MCERNPVKIEYTESDRFKFRSKGTQSLGLCPMKLLVIWDIHPTPCGRTFFFPKRFVELLSSDPVDDVAPCFPASFNLVKLAQPMFPLLQTDV